MPRAGQSKVGSATPSRAGIIKQTPMKPLRELPVPAGQTDFFTDPSLAGVACNTGGHGKTRCAAVTEPGQVTRPVTGVDCATGATPGLKDQRPGGDRSRILNKRSRPKGKPVTRRKRHKGSRKARAKSRTSQAECRSTKRGRGLDRLDVWVPVAVKVACQQAAGSSGTSVEGVVGMVLAAALGVATASTKGVTP